MFCRTLFLVVLLFTPVARAAPQAANGSDAPDPSWSCFDPALPLDQRVDDLIGRMTVDEKISQLMMASPAIPRLGVLDFGWWSEALHGVARRGAATVFPQAIALAATWNPDLHHAIARVIATEVWAKNNQHERQTPAERVKAGQFNHLSLWSPNINIFRDPRWGRGQETYGEDPFLTSRFGIAFVTGLQGDDPRYLQTVATVKHFAVHSGPEPLRNQFDAVVSERDLHETYLPAFEACIREGHAAALMSAYNAVDSGASGQPRGGLAQEAGTDGRQGHPRADRAPGGTPVPAASTAPTTVRTPILLTKEASRAMTGSLAAPNDAWTTDPRPVFSWTAVKDATAYGVWVDGDRIAENMSGTFLSAPGDLALGQHSWQVRAVGPKSMAVTVSNTYYFHIGTAPEHAWEYTDGFERGDLNDYRSSGVAITTTAISGKFSACSQADSTGTVHYAYNPAFFNHKEAESSLLLKRRMRRQITP